MWFMVQIVSFKQWKNKSKKKSKFFEIYKTTTMYETYNLVFAKKISQQSILFGATKVDSLIGNCSGGNYSLVRFLQSQPKNKKKEVTRICYEPGKKVVKVIRSPPKL